VPFNVTTGEFYVAGLGRAHLVECGYPNGLAHEECHAHGHVHTRWCANATTVASRTPLARKRKSTAPLRADRHKLNITDTTATSLPALVAYEIEVRDAGVGRDE